MKKIIFTAIAVFMFAGTAFAKELSDMATNLVTTAEKVQTTVEGLENGPDSSTDVQKSINELKEVLNKLEQGIGEETNRYRDRRPHPGPRPFPRPIPRPYPGPHPYPGPNPGPHPYPGPNPDPYPYPGPNPGPYPYPDYDNISASCRLDIDGNFFTPDTNVECTVYGRNAAGYEVRVLSRLGDSVAFHGRLDPRLHTQYFSTIERRVGGVLVKYQVYIITTYGQRIHVATL